MPTPITNTTINFSYEVPDTVFGQTFADGKTVSATYNGPDRVWVFVDESTGLYDQFHAVYTTRDDGAEIPTPAGMRKVEIVAEDNPLILSLILTGNAQLDDLTEETELLPDGQTLVLPIRSPGNTFDNTQLIHNGTQWEPLVRRTSTVTWDEVVSRRNNALTASDGRIAPDMPDSLKSKWTAYRQALRDLTVTYGKGTASEVEAWKVQLPLPPTE